MSDFFNTPIRDIDPNEKIVPEGRKFFEVVGFDTFTDDNTGEEVRKLAFRIVDDPEFEGRRMRKQVKENEKGAMGARRLLDNTLGAAVENDSLETGLVKLAETQPRPKISMEVRHFVPDDSDDPIAYIDLLSVEAA